MANKKVSNLKIYLQKNSDNVYVATWDFNTSASKTTSSSGVSECLAMPNTRYSLPLKWR